MEDADVTQGDTGPHKVKINLDMLRVLVLYRVCRHVHGAHIVAKDDNGLRKGAPKLLEELSYPASLGNGVGDGSLLCFSTGA